METPTPNNRPLADRPTLPKGLSCEFRPALAKPYVMRWREVGGKKKCVSWATLADAQKFANGWEARKEKWGQVADVVTPKEVELWKAFRAKTNGADPMEVAEFWVRHHRVLGGSLLLSDAVSRFAQIRTGKTVTGDTETHLALHLRRFSEAMGKIALRDITPAAIRSWLYGERLPSGEQVGGLRDPDSGEPMAAYTLKHHLKSVRLMLKRCVAEGWLDRSPADAVDLPEQDAEEVCVLSIADAVKLFTVNRDNPIVGKLALEAFGGLRYTSAARIHRDEILDAERGIVMASAKHKSKRRHYVDGYPDNLWAWIAHSSPVCWAVKQRAYLDAKRLAFEAAGVKNPGNVLRHSFCTYHIAANKDAARTAVLLTHRSPAMLYQHYRGHGTEADGLAYFQITPESTKKPTA